MNALTRFRVLAYLLVFLGILGFTYADHNLPFFFIGMVGLILSWLIVEAPAPHGRPLPRWCLNSGVLLASAYIFYELVIRHEESLLSTLGHFIIIILVCILFKAKKNRDYAQILTLCLLLMIIAAIFSSSLIFGVILILFFALGFYTILVFHLRMETQRALPLPAPAQMPPPDPRFKRDLRRIAFNSAFIVFIIASVVFLVFPRDLGRDRFNSIFSPRSLAHTGFSEHIAFSDIMNLKQSQKIAFQVRIEQNNVNIGSEAEQPYFRAMTLDLYDINGRQWIHNNSYPLPWLERNTSPMQELTPDKPLLLATPNSYLPAGLIKQTFNLLNPTGNFLPAIPEPVTLTSAHIFSVRADKLNNTIAYRSQATNNIEYVVESFPYHLKSTAPASANLAFYGSVYMDMRRLRPYSQPLPPVIVDLARQWSAPHLSPADLAPPSTSPPTPLKPLSAMTTRLVAEAFVRQLQAYPYSLNTQQVESNLDPTADFLKNRKTIGGHCEFFASSMVLLCTAVNIPARIATGYYGGEYNPLGGFYTVRQLHAHAWVEVFIPNEGWITFDPTPPNTELTVSVMPAWIRWMEDLVQTLEHQWFTGIVSFDNSTRKYLAEQIFTPLANTGSAVAQTLWIHLQSLGYLLVSDFYHWPTHLLAWLDLLAILTGCAWLGWHRYRLHRAPLTHILKKADPSQRARLQSELGFYNDFIRILEQTGIKSSPSQTPCEYVQSVYLTIPSIRDEAERIVTLFYDIRFGGSHTTPEQRLLIPQTLQSIRSKIRGGQS